MIFGEQIIFKRAGVAGNADMSADSETDWIDIGSCREFCLLLSNPATGTPVGSYKLYVGWSKTDSAEYGTPIAPQPTGAAYLNVVDLVATQAPGFYLKWDWTSGGTGAYITCKLNAKSQCLTV